MPALISYVCLILVFSSAWLPDISSQYFSWLLLTVLLEFYVIQFVAFYQLYAVLYAEPEKKFIRSAIALTGVFLFSAALSYSYQSLVVFCLPWLLFFLRLRGTQLDAQEEKEGVVRLYVCFRWLFDLCAYIVLALILLALPVPELLVAGLIKNLGFITAGPWVDSPQLAAAQGVLYFLLQSVLYVKAKELAQWLDSLAVR